jgi:hypothetical protein
MQAGEHTVCPAGIGTCRWCAWGSPFAHGRLDGEVVPVDDGDLLDVIREDTGGTETGKAATDDDSMARRVRR